MEKILGVLGMGEDNRDFIEEIAGNENLTSAKCFSNMIYNQNNIDKYSCTSSASIGAISDITGLHEEVDDIEAINGTTLTLSFRKQAWQRQLETGAVPGKGDYVQNGVKQAVKLFNEEFPELKYYLKYYRISNIYDTQKVINILNGGSSIVTGYTSSMYSDAQDNGVIDNNDNRDGGGHCIRIVKAETKDGIEKIVYCDNYEGKNKFNVIEVPDFQNNKDFFTGGYYLKKIYK